ELVEQSAATAPHQRCFRILKGDGTPRDLLDGLAAGAGDARRPLREVVALPPEQERGLRTRQQFLKMLELPASERAQPAERLLAQLGPMLKGLPEHRAAESAYAVARHLASTGEWSLAREAFLWMTERYPTSPRCLDAYRWLIHHNVSSEARRRQE